MESPATNNNTAKPASGTGMLPKLCRLTYPHDTPTPNMPRPKRKPRHPARPGEAPCHATNNSAGARIASGKKSKGENASGSRQPARHATASAQAGGSGKGLLLCLLPDRLFNRSHFQQVNATAVGTQDFKTQIVNLDLLAAARHVAEAVHDQSADGLDLVVGQPRVQAFIEIGQRHQRLDHVFATLARHDHDVVVN